MSYPRKASICIPTRNGAPTIGRLLRAALSQTVSIPYDILVIDTESTDGTVEIAGAFPVRLRRISKDEFNHGDTRNLGAALTDGDVIVYLTQDAVPADEHWLSALLEEFHDKTVAGAYSRNLPPPGVSPLVHASLERDPVGQAERRVHFLKNGELESLDPLGRRLLFDFNDVSSAIRRQVWERFPFPRTTFGEDILFARGAIEAGYKIVFAPNSRVFHGHDDKASVAGRRARIDGEFNIEHLGRVCVASFGDAIRLGFRLAWQDHKYLKRAQASRMVKWRERARLPRLRLSQTIGLWSGGRSRLRVDAPRMLERDRLRLLYVVHGYPPESFAGTEVYTYNLAREVAARGHAVGVFYRSTRPDLPEFGIAERDDNGVTLFPCAHQLEFRHAGESYAHPSIEARFREVLDRFRPDIVHFQHLLHLSARLVAIARERGAGTIITMNDYWAVCPRVQLQRPDGSLCGGRKELGCLLCLKHRHLKTIDWVARGTRLFRPAVDWMVRRYENWLQEGRVLTRRKRDIVAIYRRDRTVIDAFATADLLIAPSRFLRDLVLKLVPEFDPQRVLFSGYGMKIDGIYAAPKTTDPLGRIRFGFLGSLVPYKGVAVAIEAMSRINDPRAVLMIFGRFDPEKEPYHKELLELSKRNPNINNIEFHGLVDNSNIVEVFKQIDALIVPSTWYENAPLTIREAHLAGTPVITSDLGGMAESVRTEVDGLKFKPGDPESLASLMLQIIANPERLRGLCKDFPDPKTARENAGELEFRYRGLVARRRATTQVTVAEFKGTGFVQKSGNVESQGDGLALLRPGGGGAFVEYRFKNSVPGDMFLRIETFILGPERDTPVAGTVEVNGQTVGSLPIAVSADARDTVREWTGRVRLRSGRNTIRLYNHLPDGREVFLRVRRVIVRRENTGEQL
ncbi:MAG: glycosyltransferase [Planctomycetes bacterium]|nr:glycosyltransferase [Planctomycetota bacterium]